MLIQTGWTNIAIDKSLFDRAARHRPEYASAQPYVKAVVRAYLRHSMYRVCCELQYPYSKHGTAWKCDWQLSMDKACASTIEILDNISLIREGYPYNKNSKMQVLCAALSVFLLDVRQGKVDCFSLKLVRHKKSLKSSA